MIALTRAPRQINKIAAHTFANFCQDAEMVRDEFEVCRHVCWVQVWWCGVQDLGVDEGVCEFKGICVRKCMHAHAHDQE